jgi:hypothetical protein
VPRPNPGPTPHPPLPSLLPIHVPRATAVNTLLIKSSPFLALDLLPFSPYTTLTSALYPISPSNLSPKKHYTYYNHTKQTIQSNKNKHILKSIYN